jgi:hypothetical protein
MIPDEEATVRHAGITDPGYNATTSVQQKSAKSPEFALFA